MKILAFSDIHGNINFLNKIYKKSEKENPDIIICAGDILNFWKYSNEIKQLIHKLNKLTLLIHGNHEDQRLIEKFSSNRILNIHKKVINFKNFNFIGYGGGGFEQENKKLEVYFNKIKNKLDNWVFVTHAPPFNTELDLIYDYHVGSKSIREIIERFNPRLNICGHLHENFYIDDRIKKTIIINPGPEGRIINL